MGSWDRLNTMGGRMANGQMPQWTDQDKAGWGEVKTIMGDSGTYLPPLPFQQQQMQVLLI